MSARERLECDVAVVGAGPAGLAFACRLLQLARLEERELTVMVLEKAARVGGHLISGALLETTPLDLLFPHWEGEGAPVGPAVTKETLSLFTASRAMPLPVSRAFSHQGMRLLSLGRLCRWLAERAETLGAEILPGFPAVELLEEEGVCRGVVTGDRGVGRAGKFQPGVEVRARLTVLAEGCRGFLSQRAIRRWGLAAGRPPQTHGLGFKELWQCPGGKEPPGEIRHTLGWPLDRHTHGGGFLYHLPEGRVALGFVVALDYRNPWLDPFAAFQAWKNHPHIAPLLVGGRPLAAGARTLVEGGWASMPALVFEGGLLVGDGAGLLDPARLQGVAPAMMSGLLAADAAIKALEGVQPRRSILEGYERRWRTCSMAAHLHRGRNLRPAFRAGRIAGLLHAAWTGWSKGREPWTFTWSREDRACLREAARCTPPGWPPPDGGIAFDRSALLHWAGQRHEPEQPVHLRVKDEGVLRRVALERHAAPEERYCPGGVYGWSRGAGEPRLEIRAAHCLHCRACDIKDPADVLRWTPPEGGSGPDYRDL